MLYKVQNATEFKYEWFLTHCILFLGFSGGSVEKYLPANAGDAGSIPGSERSPVAAIDNSFQYSCLGNRMDRGA